MPRHAKRSRRPRLTHFEVRRNGALRLRLAIADSALDYAGDELGALIRRVAPRGVATRIAPDSQSVAIADTDQEFVVSPEHQGDDVAYHESLRERLVELFNSLCDASLADALEIASEVRARRAEGGN